MIKKMRPGFEARITYNKYFAREIQWNQAKM